MKGAHWYLYLLWNPVTRLTYIGSTTDPQRRLRQHNGEIKGGARSTKKGAPHWVLLCTLSGFRDRSEACRWERLTKHRARGIMRRALAFRLVAAGVCPPGKRHYEVPVGIIFDTYLRRIK